MCTCSGSQGKRGGGGGETRSCDTARYKQKQKRLGAGAGRGRSGGWGARGRCGRYLAKVEGSSLLPTTEALCSFSFSTPFISQGSHFNEDGVS